MNDVEELLLVIIIDWVTKLTSIYSQKTFKGDQRSPTELMHTLYELSYF